MRWRLIAAVVCLTGLVLALAAVFGRGPGDARRPDAPTFTVAQVTYGLLHHRARWLYRPLWLHAYLHAACPPACGLGLAADEPLYGFTDRATLAPDGTMSSLDVEPDTEPFVAGAPSWVARLPLIGATLARAWSPVPRTGLGYYRVYLTPRPAVSCAAARPWCATAVLL